MDLCIFNLELGEPDLARGHGACFDIFACVYSVQRSTAQLVALRSHHHPAGQQTRRFTHKVASTKVAAAEVASAHVITHITIVIALHVGIVLVLAVSTNACTYSRLPSCCPSSFQPSDHHQHQEGPVVSSFGPMDLHLVQLPFRGGVHPSYLRPSSGCRRTWAVAHT